MVYCQECQAYVSRLSSHKKSSIHKSNCLIRTELSNVKIIATAFRNRIISYRVNPEKEYLVPDFFLSDNYSTVSNLISTLLRKHRSLKVNIELFITYNLPKDNTQSLKSFNTKYTMVLQSTDISVLYHDLSNLLLMKCLEFEHAESGWTIESVSHLEINIAKFSPLKAGSYIPLPKSIQNTKSCLNIKNNDEYCFLWSIVAHLYPAKNNPNRLSSYPHFSNFFNTSGMSFPPSFKCIKWFERHNTGVSVNIYGLDEHGSITGPLYKTLRRRVEHVNLLFISCKSKNHFCLIKDMGKLLHNQLTKHKSRIHLCDECFMYFSTEEKLASHNCAGIQTVLPEEGSKTGFSNYERTQRIPIVIYGDFESLLREYSDKHKSTHVENVQVHEATCFGYFICCKSNPELNDYVSYRGSNCSQKFCESICKDLLRLHKILSVQREMTPLTEEEKLRVENTTNCHICKKSFSLEDTKVLDHDHFTGKFRGPAHNSCNLNCKTCPFIPIIFHNLSGYDCHLFIVELSKICGRIKLLPKNKEKYISFTKFIPLDRQHTAQLKFVDSLNFLDSSLDNLIKTLETEDFINLKSFYEDEKMFNLARRKGVFCYDYVDSWDRYNETTLPDRNKFYNKLTSEIITNDDYNHAMNVWETFGMKTLGDYTDFYLKCDVLLLSDVFEKFRFMSLNHYNLDPCHYVSSPSLSWDAMQLYTGVELDLISDVEIYQMFEKGIRGGLAQCSRRYAKANNKYLSDYKPNISSNYLMYFDCVNLYGYVMMSKLPTGNFRFLKENELINFNVMTISSHSDTGFILEVDLHYPSEIHDNHADLPFAAEQLKVPFPLGKNIKLVSNLFDKYKYVIHYVHLQKCLEHGLQLLKIHRVLSFDQRAFLEPYITLNTTLRQNAKSEFEKNFFKKQNNSIFGKTIENKRKQVDVKLINIWSDSSNKTNKYIGAEKYISAPNFKNLAIISKDLVVIQMEPSKVILDKPIYVGFSILDLAKTHLYNFHYSVMKKIYDKNIQLCYTDTDSLLYLINTEDIYEDMKKHIKYFDTSNFKCDNVYNMPCLNKQIPGYFKDEMSGDVISEFVGLRAKLYCIETNKNCSVKKAKGVKKCVVKKLDINKYKDALFKNIEFKDSMYFIRSKNHCVYTQKVNKVVLNANDDKRQILNGSFKTLPWGHYSTIF